MKYKVCQGWVYRVIFETETEARYEILHPDRAQWQESLQRKPLDPKIYGEVLCVTEDDVLEFISANADRYISIFEWKWIDISRRAPCNPQN